MSGKHASAMWKFETGTHQDTPGLVWTNVGLLVYYVPDEPRAWDSSIVIRQGGKPNGPHWPRGATDSQSEPHQSFGSTS